MPLQHPRSGKIEAIALLLGGIVHHLQPGALDELHDILTRGGHCSRLLGQGL